MDVLASSIEFYQITRRQILYLQPKRWRFFPLWISYRSDSLFWDTKPNNIMRNIEVFARFFSWGKISFHLPKLPTLESSLDGKPVETPSLVTAVTGPRCPKCRRHGRLPREGMHFWIFIPNTDLYSRESYQQQKLMNIAGCWYKVNTSRES